MAGEETEQTCVEIGIGVPTLRGKKPERTLNGMRKNFAYMRKGLSFETILCDLP